MAGRGIIGVARNKGIVRREVSSVGPEPSFAATVLVCGSDTHPGTGELMY